MKSSSDIGNSAVRMFLQDVGRAYDLKRIELANSGDVALAALRSKRPITASALKTHVLGDFDGKCCYCQTPLTAASVCGDHLIPMNKESGGLHAWGNVVASCHDCNRVKHQSTLEVFLTSKLGLSPDNADYLAIKQRVSAFQQMYGYRPNGDLGRLATQLYHGIAGMAELMVDGALARAQNSIDRL